MARKTESDAERTQVAKLWRQNGDRAVFLTPSVSTFAKKVSL
jgi:hypothetical protein